MLCFALFLGSFYPGSFIPSSSVTETGLTSKQLTIKESYIATGARRGAVLARISYTHTRALPVVADVLNN